MVLLLLVAAACTTRADLGTGEERAQQLEKTILCPICPGESIDQSQTELARQMRGIVREKIDRGWTDEQIRGFFVERYGPEVIMEPPRRGFHLMAWVLPPAGIAAGIVALFLALRRMGRAGEAGPPQGEGEEEPLMPGDEQDEYLRRVEAALGEDDSLRRVETTPGRDREGAGERPGLHGDGAAGREGDGG